MAWVPTEAQRERWLARLRDLQRLDRTLAADWVRLGEPSPPTGSPRLDAFVWTWENATAALIQLQVALEGPSPVAVEDEFEEEEE